MVDLSGEHWTQIELVQLAALAGVAAANGSFVVAAQQLEIDATTLSRRVASLEDVVGARLVDRAHGGGPAALTEAGALVLEHADRIAVALRAADAALAAER
jgi:molybdate transport repressor ModE-like protein